MKNFRKLLWKASYILLSFVLIGNVFAEDVSISSTSAIEKFVLEAKNHAVAEGKDIALRDFMDPDNKQFKKDSLYIVAGDFEGLCLAHPQNLMVGTNMMNIKDPNGLLIFKEILEAVKQNPDGFWVNYSWQNPTTNQIETKRAFAVKIDDNWWIASGIDIPEQQK